MSMLIRYRKSGGFLQLLKVIETCEPAKKDKFLRMVENEDLRWAKAIRDKMLTTERIYSWDEKVLGDIGTQLQDKVLAAILHENGEECFNKFTRTFAEAKLLQIRGIYEFNPPTAGEARAAKERLLEETRRMICEGYIAVDAFDKSLAVPDNIEEQLENGEVSSESLSKDKVEKMVEETKAINVDKPDADLQEEVLLLKKKVLALGSENKKLRDENDKLKEQVSQFRSLIKKPA